MTKHKILRKLATSQHPKRRKKAFKKKLITSLTMIRSTILKLVPDMIETA